MTGANTPSVADVLDAAADLLTPEGAWMQDDFSDEITASAEDMQTASCWCIAGAVAHVIGEDGPAGEAWLLDHRVSDLAGVTGISGIVGWNDDPTRTQAEVIAKLREAANAARATSKEVQGNG